MSQQNRYKSGKQFKDQILLGIAMAPTGNGNLSDFGHSRQRREAGQRWLTLELYKLLLSIHHDKDITGTWLDVDPEVLLQIYQDIWIRVLRMLTAAAPCCHH